MCWVLLHNFDVYGLYNQHLLGKPMDYLDCKDGLSFVNPIWGFGLIITKLQPFLINGFVPFRLKCFHFRLTFGVTTMPLYESVCVIWGFDVFFNS